MASSVARSDWRRQLSAMATGALVRVIDRSIRRSSSLAETLSWKRHNLLYRGSEDDIFIVSFPKSGTTLVQALLYQMLTDGSTSFRHISEFSPTLHHGNVIARIRQGDTIDSLPQPHVFKSHLSYVKTPKGPGRYIYVCRHGLDVALSYYHHVRRSSRFQGSFSRFFEDFMSGQVPFGSWFKHVQTWLRNPDGLDIHVVTYEALRADLYSAARRLAVFCRVPVRDEEWTRILGNCSFDAMRARESQYATAAEGANCSDDDHFIRRGEVGGWQTVIDARMLSAFLTQSGQSFRDVTLPSEISSTRLLVP